MGRAGPATAKPGRMSLQSRLVPGATVIFEPVLRLRRSRDGGTCHDCLIIRIAKAVGVDIPIAASHRRTISLTCNGPLLYRKRTRDELYRRRPGHPEIP